MKHAVIDSTGRIVGEYDGERMQPIDHDVAGDTHYWDGNDIVPRPALATTWDKTDVTADGNDHIVLTGLSQTAEVLIEPGGNQASVAGDGSCTLAFTQAGTYIDSLCVRGFMRQKPGGRCTWRAEK